MKFAIALVITIVISIFCAIVILFLVSAIMTIEPYFKKWLQRKLEKALEPKNCESCKHCATDYTVRPTRYYCNMHDENMLRDSSCDRWERR